MYNCGRNIFEIMLNQSGTRIVKTRHLVHDNYDECDAFSNGESDWIVTNYNAVTNEIEHCCGSGPENSYYTYDD